MTSSWYKCAGPGELEGREGREPLAERRAGCERHISSVIRTEASGVLAVRVLLCPFSVLRPQTCSHRTVQTRRLETPSVCSGQDPVEGLVKSALPLAMRSSFLRPHLTRRHWEFLVFHVWEVVSVIVQGEMRVGCCLNSSEVGPFLCA